MGNSNTFRLIKQNPGFQEGMIRLIDINRDIQSSFKTDNSDLEADLNSIASDWKAVGDDMFYALDEYGKPKQD